MNEPKLLTVPEAAAELRKGRSTLYRWIKAGTVPHRKMSDGTVKLSLEDVAQIKASLHQPIAVYVPPRTT